MFYLVENIGVAAIRLLPRNIPLWSHRDIYTDGYPIKAWVSATAHHVADKQYPLSTAKVTVEGLSSNAR